MLESDPEKRLTTEEIVNERWYKEGEFASEDELKTFMNNSLKNILEQEKIEKEERSRMRQAERNARRENQTYHRGNS